MTGIDLELVNDFVAAVCCGAFVGIERERRREPDEAAGAAAADAASHAGIRSHILVAILGALGRLLDRQLSASPWFTLLALVATMLSAVTAQAIRTLRTGHYGMTSVPALLLTCALGALCLSDQRPLALALAVVVTGILAFKVPLHSFVRALTAAEIAAAVKFGLLSLVLLPLLPDYDYGPRDWPWLADRLRACGVADATVAHLHPVNPHQLLLIVVAISGAGFAGYVLVRVLGPRRGLLLTGIAGGTVSSTAVTVAMAEQSRRTPEWSRPLVAAVLAACSVMSLRVLVVSSALDGDLLAPLILPLGLLLLGNLGAASFLARRHGGTRTEGEVRIGTPLAFGPALRLTGLIFVIRVLSEIAVLAIGDAGLVLLAALSGAVDVDAITVAASQQAAAGHVATGLAAAAIGTAVAANTLFKGAIVLATGDRATGRTAAAALLLTLLAGLLGLLLSYAFGIGR